MKLHTATLNGETRLSRARNCFAIVLLACFAAAFSARGQSAPLLSSNRYLFIIDASTSMKPFDSALRETIFDLLYSGIRGRMTNGDTYGLWVVTDRNDTSFPMDIWRGRNGVEMGVKATAHVKGRAFKGKARLDLAMADALSVVKNVGDLTIVLVSNGETPVSGTPFDQAINARFRELAPQMKRAKGTVNTAFIAQNGALVAWAANAPEFLISVPQVAPKTKPVKAEVAAAQTNALAVASNVVAKTESASVSNSPVLSPKKRGGPPIIITKETVAAERREFTAMTSTVPTNPAPDLVVTNSEPTAVVSNSIVSSAAPASNQLAGSSSPTNAVVPGTMVRIVEPIRKEPESPATNVAAVILKPLKAEAKQAVASSIPPAAPAASAVAPATETKPFNSAFHPIVWALCGVIVALLCVLVGIMAARKRSEPSLISQAMGQQRIL